MTTRSLTLITALLIGPLTGCGPAPTASDLHDVWEGIDFGENPFPGPADPRPVFEFAESGSDPDLSGIDNVFWFWVYTDGEPGEEQLRGQYALFSGSLILSPTWSRDGGTDSADISLTVRRWRGESFVTGDVVDASGDRWWYRQDELPW